jgi:hypothetical protein
MQLYLSIMSTIEAGYANVFGFLVTMHLLFQLQSYFNLVQCNSASILASTTTSLVLSVGAFGYLVSASSNGEGVA